MRETALLFFETDRKEKISKAGFSEVVFTETLDEALKKLNPQVREKFIKAGGLK